jgi:polyhydroxyalkanoate synthesis regulator phasin
MHNPYDRPAGRLISRRAWWTEEGNKLPDEEKEKVMDEIQERARASARDVVVIPRQQMEQIHESLSELVKLGQMSAMEWDKLPREVTELKSQIFRLAEFPKMYARQCLELNKNP